MRIDWRFGPIELAAVFLTIAKGASARCSTHPAKMIVRDAAQNWNSLGSDMGECRREVLLKLLLTDCRTCTTWVT